MSIAEAIPTVTAARAARVAARDAERLARDTFIQSAFPLLSDRFEALLAEALGIHSQLLVTITPVVDAVQGRSFATLNKSVVDVRSTLRSTPQTVTFTPRLDFHEPDQFGLIACTLDFPFTARGARQDSIARALVARGIQMRGITVPSLMLPLGATVVEIGARDLEAAFTAWWLR